MGEKEELYEKYNMVNGLIKDEVENLKYLLDHTLISNINLINIHYSLNDLLNKRNEIKNEIYIEYGEIIIDEV